MDKGSPANLMDFDIIDDLLFDGCWLEANGLEFPYIDLDSSTFDPSFEPQPHLDAVVADFPSVSFQNEKQRSSLPENNQLTDDSKSNMNDNAAGISVVSEDPIETTEPSKCWWIGPKGSTPVMDRLIRVLSYLRSCSADRDALIQIWVPVNREGKRVLTTNDQPYSLDFNCPSLARYREISVSYQFSTDEDYKGIVGLPGRVFRTKVPEWTPDVRFFTWDEYPRIDHALKYDVRGTLVVPVLEQGNQTCLGVIEVVLTKQKIQYRPELQTVCKALEAVNLRTADLSRFQNTMTITSDLSYQAALPEILDVLGSVCTSHELPLAQTWVSCILQGKEGCRHSDENINKCVSPVESACYIHDPQIRGFHKACSEYHLLKGTGVVGKAFETNQPCYSPDVTACSITEYPLSHYARIFGLKSAVAIRLRSTSTGLVDFVLEFFLPVKCEAEEQKKLLLSLSTTVQNACRTLRIVTDEELQQESSFANSASTSAVKFVVSSTGDVNPRLQSIHQEDCEVVSLKTIPSSPGGLLSPRRLREKRRSRAEKTITLQELKQHFSGTLKEAATNLGVCPTTLKRICRQQGIHRWPSRTIKKVGHSLQKIQCVIDSVHGASSLVKMDPVYSNFSKLSASPCKPATTSVYEKIGTSSSRPAATFPSPSSSDSRSSSSKRSCSIEVHPIKTQSSSHTRHKDNHEEPADTKENLHLITDGPKLIPSSHHRPKNLIPAAETDGLRMKISYGDDTIRLRMQNHWNYLDLLQEVSARFNIEDAADFHLKYLDDDDEWILLRCDADLEEFVDLYRSSPRQTVKLLFHGKSSQPS